MPASEPAYRTSGNAGADAGMAAWKAALRGGAGGASRDYSIAPSFSSGLLDLLRTVQHAGEQIALLGEPLARVGDV